MNFATLKIFKKARPLDVTALKILKKQRNSQNCYFAVKRGIKEYAKKK